MDSTTNKNVIWTALPAGRVPGTNRVRISAHASIRLSGSATTLSGYNFALNWATNLTFTVFSNTTPTVPLTILKTPINEIDKPKIAPVAAPSLMGAQKPPVTTKKPPLGGTTTRITGITEDKAILTSGPQTGYTAHAATIVNTLVNPVAPGSAVVDGLWKAYFIGSGPVKPYGYKPGSAKNLNTLHTAAIGAYLTNLHANNAVTGFNPPAPISKLAGDPTIQNAVVSVQNLTSPTVNASPTLLAKTKMSARINHPVYKTVKSLRSTGAMPAQLHQQIVEGVYYINPPEHDTVQVPARPDIDFHQALALLGQHPSLMRMIGIVFDLEIDASQLPPSGFITLGVTGMLEGAAPYFPWTAYSLDATNFLPTPRKFASVAANVGSDYAQGFMDMTNVNLGTFDMQGGLQKVNTFAENLTFKNNKRLSQVAFKATNNLAAITPGANGANAGLQSIDPDDEPAALPAQRSAGISAYRTNRLAQIQAMTDVSDRLNQTMVAAPSPTPTDPNSVLYADDVVKGWRPDVQHGGQWHSLTARTMTYRIGNLPDLITTIPEEGQISLGVVATQTDPTTRDIASNLHESLFSWQGWSLSAPRPGDPQATTGDAPSGPVPPPQTLDEFKTWSQNQTNLDPNYKMSSLPLVVPGTLPRLRFGETYSIRARAVDLAGNSLPLTASGPASTVLTTPYLRHEPIPSPSVYFREKPTGRGETPHVMVIRKYKAGTTPAGTDSPNRHLLPPPGGESLAELHGLLDDAAGAPGADVYASILQPADATAKTNPLPNPPIIPQDAVGPLPYLPDSTSMGATLRPAQWAWPVPFQKVSWYGASATWPNPQTAKLHLLAGTATAASTTAQDISVTLVPGQAIDFQLSSNTTVDHLADFQSTAYLESMLSTKGLSFVPVVQSSGVPTAVISKVVNKLQTFGTHVPFGVRPSASFAAPVTRFVTAPVLLSPSTLKVEPIRLSPNAHIGQPTASEVLSSSNIRALMFEPYLDGFNGALTPGSHVRMVYATQVPEPGFQILAMSATRVASKTYAGVAFAGQVHGWSTHELEFMAAYTDQEDNLSEARRVTKSVLKTHRAFSLNIPYVDSEAINRVTQTGVEEFHDTKAHFVSYNIVLKSRYKEFFPSAWPVTDSKTKQQDPTTVFTQTVQYTTPSLKPGAREIKQAKPSEVPANTVIIPSSKRPEAPGVEYIMPSFDWANANVAGTAYSAKRGNMFRIYLRRPWFTSGNFEKLGIVLMKGLTDADTDHRSHFTTQWGADPVFTNTPVSEAPTPANFPFAARTATNVPISEVPGATADVVLFDPTFDDNLQMWYVDVEMRLRSASYAPFIRLALCRYQEYSMSGVEMSSIVLADVAQLQPDRLAALQVTKPGQQVKVTMAGIQGVSATGPNRVIGTLEAKVLGDADAGWAPAVDAKGSLVTRLVPFLNQANATIPRVLPVDVLQTVGNIDIVNPQIANLSPIARISPTGPISIPEPGPTMTPEMMVVQLGVFDLPDPALSYRIVLREYEVHPSASGAPNVTGESGVAGRLVHVDVVSVPKS